MLFTIVEHEQGTSSVIEWTEELSNEFIDYLESKELNDNE